MGIRCNSSTEVYSKNDYAEEVMRPLFIRLSMGFYRAFRPWSLRQFICLLPVFFILFSLGIGFLRFSSLSLVLPFISCISLALCLFYRVTGLIVSYALLFLGLYLFLPISSLYWKDLLWYEGLIFSLSLSLYGFFLAIEEMDSEVKEKDLSVQERLEQAKISIERGHNELALLREQYSSLELRFQEALRLNENLETEKICYEKKQGFLEKELNELSLQKSLWIEDFSELFKKYQCLNEQLITKINQPEKTIDPISEPVIIQNIVSPEDGDLFQKKLVLSEDMKILKKELADKNGMYKQLREQFQEKTKALSSARKTLFEREEELFALKREESVFLSVNEEEAAILLNCISDLEKEVNFLQEQVIFLEGLVSHSLSQ